MAKIFENNPTIRQKYVRAVLSKIVIIDNIIYLRPLSAPASPVRDPTYKVEDPRQTYSQEIGRASYLPRGKPQQEKFSTITIQQILKDQKSILTTDIDTFFSIFGKKDKEGNVQTNIYGPSHDATVSRQVTGEVTNLLPFFPEEEVRLMNIGIVREVADLIQVFKMYQSRVIDAPLSISISTPINAQHAVFLNASISPTDIAGIAEVFSTSSFDAVIAKVNRCNAAGGGGSCSSIFQAEYAAIDENHKLSALKRKIDALILTRGEITAIQKQEEKNEHDEEIIRLVEQNAKMAVSIIAGAVLEYFKNEDGIRILHPDDPRYEDWQIQDDATTHFRAFYNGSIMYFSTYPAAILWLLRLLITNPEFDIDEVEVFPVGQRDAAAAATSSSGGRRKGTRKGTRKGARKGARKGTRRH